MARPYMEGAIVMKTYVLIQAAPGTLGPRLAQQIAGIPGVDRVVHVAGPFDVVAEVDRHETLTDETLPRINDVEGVLHAIPLHVTDDGTATDAGVAAEVAASV
jgi:nitrate reductase NapAB chaperone NapD